MPTEIFFTDTQTGYILATDSTSDDAWIVLKTTEGGTDWTEVLNEPDRQMIGMHFTSPDTGTIVGREGIILRTVDGGQTWIDQNSGTTEDLWEVVFINAMHGFVAGSNGMLLTTWDGGSNWYPMVFPSTSDITQLYQVSDHILYAHTNSTKIYKWDIFTGIVQQRDEQEIIIHPNPANGIFSISTSQAIDGIVVHDHLGRKTSEVIPFHYGMQLDLSKHPAGIYHVSFVVDGKTWGVHRVMNMVE